VARITLTPEDWADLQDGAGINALADDGQEVTLQSNDFTFEQEEALRQGKPVELQIGGVLYNIAREEKQGAGAPLSPDDPDLQQAIDKAVAATSEAEGWQARLLRERAMRRIEELFPGAHLVKVISDHDEYHNFYVTVHRVHGAEGECLFDSAIDYIDDLSIVEDDLSDAAILDGDVNAYILDVVALRLDQDRVTINSPNGPVEQAAGTPARR
jgi:hypothetical protein